MTKNRSLITILFIAVFSLSLLLSGCGMVAQKAADKAAATAIQSSVGGDAKVDVNKDNVSVTTKDGSMKVGGATEWPSTMPADVPKFSYGKITSAMENTTSDGLSIVVGIDGVALADLDKYKSDLEGAGWEITTTSKTDDASILSAEKGKNTVTVSFSIKDDKTYSGGISYIEGK
jgi:uncharacterized protein YceK